MENLMWHLMPHIKQIPENPPENLKRLTEIYENPEGNKEEILDILEPYIQYNESYMDMLIESRKELVRAFRKVRPEAKTTSFPVFIDPKPVVNVKKPKRQVATKKAVELVVPDGVSFSDLEKESEKLLDSMG